MNLFSNLKNIGVLLILGSIVKYIYGFAIQVLTVATGIWVCIKYFNI